MGGCSGPPSYNSQMAQADCECPEPFFILFTGKAYCRKAVCFFVLIKNIQMRAEGPHKKGRGRPAQSRPNGSLRPRKKQNKIASTRRLNLASDQLDQRKLSLSLDHQIFEV